MLPGDNLQVLVQYILLSTSRWFNTSWSRFSISKVTLPVCLTFYWKKVSEALGAFWDSMFGKNLRNRWKIDTITRSKKSFTWDELVCGHHSAMVFFTDINQQHFNCERMSRKTLNDKSDSLDEAIRRSTLSSSNQMEMLTFRLTDGQLYGINVFKIIEILECPNRINKVPQAHPAINARRRRCDQTDQAVGLRT